jgi:hypothetical protein
MNNIFIQNTQCRLRPRPANKVLPKAGLNGFNWTLMQGSTAVLLLNFCVKNPSDLQASKRICLEQALQIG